MRKYLATLHKRPDHHKKRFALVVSGGFTLLVFAIWTLVTFGNDGDLRKNDQKVERAHEEVSPIDSLRSGAAESLNAIEDSVKELRSGVLNSYGQ